MIDDRLMEQLRKTREGNFKTCLARGITRCVSWHLADTPETSQILLNLFREPSLAPVVIQNMQGKLHSFSDKELQRFLVIIENVPIELRTGIIKQSILKQNEYMSLFQLLGSIYYLLPAYDEALNVLQRGIKLINKRIEQAEVIALLHLLVGKPDNFKQMIFESGIVSFVGKLLDSPNIASIQFYAQLFAEKSFVERLNLTNFYREMVNKSSLSRVLLELNPNESTEDQIISSWLDELCWTRDIGTIWTRGIETIWTRGIETIWRDPFPLCIQEIDAKLTTLTPQHFPKVADRAADELLSRMQIAKKTALDYVACVEQMKSDQFRDIYAMKCIDRKMVEDIDTLISYQNKHPESIAVEKIVSETIGLTTAPSYQELKHRLIYMEDIEIRWKRVLDKYVIYQRYNVAKQIVADLTKFGNSLLSKTMEIKFWLELQKKPEEMLRKMTTNISQALSYTKEDLVATFHMTVKANIQEASAIPLQLDTLQAFLDDIVPEIAEKHILHGDLDQVKYTLPAMNLASFTLPARLAPLLQVAEMCVYYRRSGLFKSYLNQAKGANALTLANVTKVCENAEKIMFNFLSGCIPSIQTTPMSKIVATFNYDDWWKEISLLRKWKEWEHQLDTLTDCLFMYHNRDKLIANSHLMLKLCEVIKLDDQKFKELLATIIRNIEQNDVTVADFITSNREANAVLQPEGQGEKAIGVLAALLQSAELLEFLNGLTASAIAYSLECVHDFESSVTVELIKELEVVWIFFNDLKTGSKTYEAVINFIKAKLVEAKYQGIVKAIQICTLSIPAFKELRANQEKKEETKRKQMEDIVDFANIAFTGQGQTIEVRLSYKKDLSGSCNLSVLSELKDRASLTLHSAKSSYDQRNVGVLSTFVTLVTELQQIVELLMELKDSGYPRDMTTGEVFECRQGIFSALNQYTTECKELLIQWSKSLETAYINNHFLCYLYSSQFWTVERHLTIASDSSPEALHLLDYIGKKACKNSGVVPTDPVGRLTYLGELLSMLPTSECVANKIDYEVTVDKKACSPGVLYVSVEEKDYLRALLSVYLHTEGKVPKAHQVLFCSGTTEWAELLAFLYRCFTCPASGEIYTLVGCEKLPLALQTKFRNLFSTSVDSRVGSGYYTFAVITANNECLLSEYFTLMEGRNCLHVRQSQLIESDELLGTIIKQVDSRVLGSDISDSIVVVSAMAGVGKSTWVRKQANLHGKTIVKFPIAGDMNLERICRRLLEKLEGTPWLHVILSHVDDTEILNDLLTHFIIFRTVRAGSLVTVIPRACRMFIEVTNLQPNLILKLPVLTYLTTHIVTFSTDDLAISPDARFVCAYLDALTNGTLNSEDTAIESKPMNDRQCKDLLINYFIKPTYAKGQDVTFASINSFVQSMKALLLNFQRGPFSWTSLQEPIIEARNDKCSEIVTEYTQLRSRVLQSLIDTTEELTTRCIKQVCQAQELKSHSQEGVYECTVKWSDSNHFSMIFIEDGSHLAIYRKQQDVPQSVRKLIFLQLNVAKHDFTRLVKSIASGNYLIPNYSGMTHQELLAKLETYGKGQDLSATLAESSYVLTPDNFLKMNLIYLRALAGFPVVIMGETGCGKTSLVRFFLEKVLREKLLIFNIHAGVISTNLFEYVQQIITEFSSNPSRRLWVFFDEFNTSDTVGEICEMLTERTYHGSPLPANVVFVAACNPYRLRSPHLAGDKVGIKKSERYKRKVPESLMHVVKPLPEPVLEYLWDFGNLAPDDCKMYIGKMLERLDCAYLELFEKLVWTAQDYFQKSEDVSSVSLRDVMRFTIFYKWFRSTLPIRKHNFSAKCEDNCRKYKLKLNWRAFEDEHMAAGILALCSCYYFRLSQKDHRAHLLDQLVAASEGRINKELILQTIEMNEYDIIARMQLPNATALNQAFRENIASMVNCIFSKIPLFICGKPGCSKSLSIQLVFGNLKGDKSGDEFFRTLPELVMVPFQGSESSTSEGIEKVFEKANKFLTQGTQLNLLPVVIFDEIGLAEISKHNPLKVLHSLLELETIAVGFIGVSNWRLDASKMNRAMYLARPDPEIEELTFTGRSILTACSFENVVEAHTEVVDALAKAYLKYKQELRDTNPRYEEFYGLRDFYSMIKQTSHALIDRSIYEEKEQFQVAKRAIERNFGGLPGASARMVQLLLQVHPRFEVHATLPDTPTITLINENLKDTGARFLMLLCKGDIATYAIEKVLELSSKERRTIIGSHMAEDESGEEYAFRALSDMILYMEKDISVILKDMDSIYTSLYDLFNQNFTVSGDRRYCRVALGAQFNPRCYVHNDFHVIVFISDEDEEIERIDAPFLNRFEKHRFSIEEMFNTKAKDVYETLLKWKEDLFTLIWGKPVVISENHVFPLYSEEYLKLLVLFVQDTASLEELLITCKQNLLKTATEEVLVLAHASVLDAQEKEFIFATWNTLHNTSFHQYLSNTHANHDAPNSLIFTYDTEGLLNEKNLPDPSAYVVQHFSVFKCERDLVQDLDFFYKNHSKATYILNFSLSKNSKHLAMVKFTFERKAKEFQNPAKRLILLVQMKRNENIDVEVCWFEKWDIQTFTSLQETGLSVRGDFLGKSYAELFEMEKISCFRDEIGRMLKDAYDTILFRQGKLRNAKEKATSSNRFIALPEDINKSIFTSIDIISENRHIISAFRSKILALMQKQEGNWVEKVLCNADCIARAPNLQKAVCLAVETEAAYYLTQVLFEVEKGLAMRSCSVMEAGKVLQNIWMSEFEALPCRETVSMAKQSNMLDFSILLSFPFITKEKAFIEAAYSQICASNTDSAAIETAFEHRFEEQSIVRHELYNLKLHKTLYQRELLYLDLLDKDYLFPWRNVLVAMQTCIAAEKGSLAGKVLSFVQQRDFCLTVCEIVALAKDMVQDVSASFIASFKVLKGSVRNYYESVAEEESAYIKQIRKSIAKHICEIISYVVRTYTNPRAGRTIAAFSLDVSRFFDLATKLNATYQIDIDAESNAAVTPSSALCIWDRTLALLSSVSDGQKTLEKILQKTSGIEYLFDIDVVIMLCIQVDKSCQKEESLRYKAIYYAMLLRNGTREAVELIKKAVNWTEDFWKYSTGLVKEILEMGELHSGVRADISTFLAQIEFQEDIMNLENALTDSMDTNFAVMLSDELAGVLLQSPSSLMTLEIEERLAREEGNFETMAALILNPPTDYTNILTIYAHAYMRVYYEYYCKVATEDAYNIPSTEGILAKARKMALQVPAIELYVLKYLRDDISTLCHTKPALAWASYHFERDEFMTFLPRDSREIFYSTLECLEKGRSLASTIATIAAPKDKFAFGFAFFMNELGQGKRITSSFDLLQAERVNIQAVLGLALSRLLYMFTTSFPQGSILEVTPQSSPAQRQMSTILSYYLLIVLSYSTNGNALTAPFLHTSGNVHPNITDIVENRLIVGTRDNPIYLDLKTLLNRIKAKDQTPLFQCSADCPYIYSDSKTKDALKQCPLCRRPLGKLDSGALKHSDYKKITRGRAIEVLTQALETYSTHPPPGLWLLPYCKEVSFRGLDATSNRLMSLFTCSLVYYLHLSECVTNGQIPMHSLYEPSNPLDLLSAAILEEMKALEKIAGGDGALWWPSLISQLPALLDRVEEDRNIPLSRNAFELIFQQTTLKWVYSKDDKIRDINERSQQEIRTTESRLKEGTETVSATPFLALYRLKVPLGALKIESDFRAQKLETIYPLLNLCLNHQQAVSELELFPLLLDLTRTLYDRYNRKIRREAAKKIKIEKVLDEDQRLRGVYMKAAEMWSSCSSLKDAYSLFQGEDQDCLASFVLDRKDGNQLFLVLQKLASIENSIISEFFSIQKARKRPHRPGTLLPLHDLQSSQLLSLSLASFSTSETYLANPVYGKGVEVICNYAKMEEAVTKRLEQAVMINSSQMTFVQYQFELLSGESQYQHLIVGIRNEHAQREFTPDEKKIAIDAFTKRESETTDMHQSRLLAHYEQIESLMCLQTRSEKAQNMTIQQFANQYSKHWASALFTVDSALTALSIELIVAVYEQLEVEFFNYAKQLISPEFKQEEATLADLIRTLKFESVPPTKDLVRAVMRLIMRVLLANAEASQPISQYITRPDLWAVTVNKKEVEKFAEVLDSRCLGVVLQLYDLLYQLCVAADMQAMASKEIPAEEKPKAASRGKRKGGFKPI